MADLYTEVSEKIGFADVLEFILAAEQTNAATESSTFEFKRQLMKSNVAEAIAALANADGGLVLGLGLPGVRERIIAMTQSCSLA